MAFQRCLLIQKQAKMTHLSSLSESVMRSVECDGPNGIYFPLGLAPAPPGLTLLYASEFDTAGLDTIENSALKHFAA